MGCFDTVIGKCPKCDGRVEIQSKAGECNLKKYQMNRVPADIAMSIQDSIALCHSCNAKFTIKPVRPIARIEMELVPEGKSDDDDYD